MFDNIPLDKLNMYAALAHIVSFLIIGISYLALTKSRKFAKTQTYRYQLPTVAQSQSTCNSDEKPSDILGKCQVESPFPPPKKAGSFNVIYGVLVFFGITAYAHIYYFTDGFKSGKYTSAIKKGWNPYRWVEYGVSATVMTVLIASQLGIRDANHLVSLSLINVALQLCGFIVEAGILGDNAIVVKGATGAGWVLFLGMWIPILYAFLTIYQDVEEKYNQRIDPTTGRKVSIPSFVWSIVIFQLLSFFLFGWIQFKQVREYLRFGKVESFIKYERQYTGLSFSAKLALASGLGYGLLFRTSGC